MKRATCGCQPNFLCRYHYALRTNATYLRSVARHSGDAADWARYDLARERLDRHLVAISSQGTVAQRELVAP